VIGQSNSHYRIVEKLGRATGPDIFLLKEAKAEYAQLQ